MLIQITDANGISQTVNACTQESITSADGSITSANVSQTIVVGNSLRSGWIFQNTSSANLYIEDVSATATVGKGYQVAAGQILSTYLNIPNSSNPIQVIGGTAGQTFTFRQW